MFPASFVCDLDIRTLIDCLPFPIEKGVIGEPKFLPIDVQTVAMTVDDSERYGGMLNPLESTSALGSLIAIFI